jgi:predicted dinucleotide-binding enzyme
VQAELDVTVRPAWGKGSLWSGFKNAIWKAYQGRPDAKRIALLVAGNDLNPDSSIVDLIYEMEGLQQY